MLPIRLTFALALALAAGGCSWFAPAQPPATRPAPPRVMPPTSEWFPSLVPPTALPDTDRAALLRACGVTAANVIWIQYIDLDADRTTDALVTLALPPVANTDDSRTFTTVTFVFRGRAEGAFVQPFAVADRAFALVTEVATVGVGSELTVSRRQFSVRRTAAGLFLTVNDTSYATAPNDPARVLGFTGSTTATINSDDIPSNRPLTFGDFAPAPARP